MPIAVDVKREFHGSFLPPDNLLGNKKQKFNLGFELLFYEDQAFPPKTKGATVSILPRTLGAEVFFSCEPNTMLPVYLAFMDGGAFSIKYFTRYIEEVENALQRAIASHNNWPLPEEQFVESFHSKEWIAEQLSKRKPLKRHKYLRVMVIYDDICFLSFPRNELPIHQGTRYRIAEGEGCCIDCCVDDEGLVCFDGWLKTTLPHKSEWKLVSLPKGCSRGNNGEP